jgi:UDP-glucose 4-epimerase
MDNLATGHLRYVKQLKSDKLNFMFGDILSMEDCKKAVKGVEYVYHLAAMSKVVPSLKDPEMAKFCVESNEIGTWNVLMAAREEGVKKVIYAASSTYYGNQPTPQTEEMAPDFLNPYAASKYGGEVQMQLFSELFGVPTVSCRFFMGI